jgi:hypothetical protein
MNECRRLWGEIRLLIPARRASRLTIRSAAERSIRRPLADRNSGPLVRSPRYKLMARDVRGANGTTACLPPLRTMLRMR